MIDFELSPIQKPKLPEFTVSEFCNILKSTLEDTFAYVRIKGEISGLKIAPSGHVYFNIKDQDAVIAAICWKGNISNIPFKLEDGLEVICGGKITIYAGRSTYQIIVSNVEMAGIGAILAMLEKRKKKLEAEGLFAQERKQELPLIPAVIGIITSPTGAVIRDILHRISERFPLHVIVWPVLVQGNEAAEQIAMAIDGFQTFEPKPDLLIVARGGGSIEDLMPFNEEVVVRAAANSSIPLISAVGHETDTTLIDFAADKRAPTPTGAAEIAVPVKGALLKTNQDLSTRMNLALQAIFRHKEAKITKAQLTITGFLNIITSSIAKFQNYDLRIRSALHNLLQMRKFQLAQSSHKLDIKRLTSHIEALVQGNKSYFKSLNLAFINYLHNKQLNLEGATRLLQSLNYKSVLKRGFTMIWDGKMLITKATDFKEGKGYKIEFSDGLVSTARKPTKKQNISSHVTQKDLFSYN